MINGSNATTESLYRLDDKIAALEHITSQRREAQMQKGPESVNAPKGTKITVYLKPDICDWTMLYCKEDFWSDFNGLHFTSVKGNEIVLPRDSVVMWVIHNEPPPAEDTST